MDTYSEFTKLTLLSINVLLALYAITLIFIIDAAVYLKIIISEGRNAYTLLQSKYDRNVKYKANKVTVFIWMFFLFTFTCGLYLFWLYDGGLLVIGTRYEEFSSLLHAIVIIIPAVTFIVAFLTPTLYIDSITSPKWPNIRLIEGFILKWRYGCAIRRPYEMLWLITKLSLILIPFTIVWSLVS